MHLRVLTVAMLRQLLAPIVETIILLDRYLYLAGDNSALMHSVDLIPLFDHKYSPRCWALVGIKK